MAAIGDPPIRCPKCDEVHGRGQLDCRPLPFLAPPPTATPETAYDVLAGEVRTLKERLDTLECVYNRHTHLTGERAPLLPAWARYATQSPSKAFTVPEDGGSKASGGLAEQHGDCCTLCACYGRGYDVSHRNAYDAGYAAGLEANT